MIPIRLHRRCATLATLALLSWFFESPINAVADEGAISTRAPGVQGPMGGFLPPPGFYGQESLYIYQGKANAAPFQGKAQLDVKLQMVVNLLQATYVAKPTILGGNIGFSGTVPVGYARLKGDLSAGPLNLSNSRSDFDIGDFALTPLIGWHLGEFHLTASVTGTIPSGSYQESNVVNVSLNRFAVDPTLGVTWLDTGSLIELSTVVGYTVNFENSATHYDSGNSLHVDLAAIKHFQSGFALGAVAYGEFQLTNDTGSGATLGGFRGRAIGVGPVASYDVAIGDVKFNGSIRYYREVDTKNRFEGDTGFVGVTFKF
jgi:hypothetical protein